MPLWILSKIRTNQYQNRSKFTNLLGRGCANSIVGFLTSTAARIISSRAADNNTNNNHITSSYSILSSSLSSSESVEIMKLFYAAAAVALAKQASAYRVVLNNDNTYCIAQVKNDGSTDWTVTSSVITAAPAAVLLNEDDSPTIAQNGLNDPTGEIKTAVDGDWATFVSDWTAAGGPGNASPNYDNDLTITVYEAGATTEYASLAGLPAPTGTSVDWCKAYSTMAPDHYCKADGDYSSYQLPLKSDMQTCCEDNHASNPNACLLVSTGVVSSIMFDLFLVFVYILSLSTHTDTVPQLCRHFPPPNRSPPWVTLNGMLTTRTKSVSATAVPITSSIQQAQTL